MTSVLLPLLLRTKNGAADSPGVASAFNALMEGFCAVWLIGGGEPIGRSLGDDEAIDTLTGLLRHGLTGPGHSG